MKLVKNIGVSMSGFDSLDKTTLFLVYYFVHQYTKFQKYCTLPGDGVGRQRVMSPARALGAINTPGVVGNARARDIILRIIFFYAVADDTIKRTIIGTPCILYVK